jgi:hypothetical protein
VATGAERRHRIRHVLCREALGDTACKSCEQRLSEQGTLLGNQAASHADLSVTSVYCTRKVDFDDFAAH